MKAIAALVLMLPAMALAQPYIELGVGSPTGGCIQQHPHLCSQAPLGMVAMGWQLPNNFRLQWEHWSSLKDGKDRGVEIVSLRWRFNLR